MSWIRVPLDIHTDLALRAAGPYAMQAFEAFLRMAARIDAEGGAVPIHLVTPANLADWSGLSGHKRHFADALAGLQRVSLIRVEGSLMYPDASAFDDAWKPDRTASSRSAKRTLQNRALKAETSACDRRAIGDESAMNRRAHGSTDGRTDETNERNEEATPPAVVAPPLVLEAEQPVEKKPRTKRTPKEGAIDFDALHAKVSAAFVACKLDPPDAFRKSQFGVIAGLVKSVGGLEAFTERLDDILSYLPTDSYWTGGWRELGNAEPGVYNLFETQWEKLGKKAKGHHGSAQAAEEAERERTANAAAADLERQKAKQEEETPEQREARLKRLGEAIDRKHEERRLRYLAEIEEMKRKAS